MRQRGVRCGCLGGTPRDGGGEAHEATGKRGEGRQSFPGNYARDEAVIRPPAVRRGGAGQCGEGLGRGVTGYSTPWVREAPSLI